MPSAGKESCSRFAILPNFRECFSSMPWTCRNFSTRRGTSHSRVADRKASRSGSPGGSWRRVPPAEIGIAGCRFECGDRICAAADSPLSAEPVLFFLATVLSFLSFKVWLSRIVSGPAGSLSDRQVLSQESRCPGQATVIQVSNAMALRSRYASTLFSFVVEPPISAMHGCLLPRYSAQSSRKSVPHPHEPTPARARSSPIRRPRRPACHAQLLR